MRRRSILAPLVPLLFLSCINHHLIHPRHPPERCRTFRQDLLRGELLLHMEGASPEAPGPFPTILVHPLAGKTAADLRGVVWDLAARGYLAVAVDYERLIEGKYRPDLFAWRSEGDPLVALQALAEHPLADADRLAVLGFSQGGVYGLLIAALDPDVRAAIAYYPVTDFEHWLSRRPRNPIERIVRWTIRRYFRQKSGVQSDDEFRRMLRGASPYHHAADIHARVLLVHGDRDRSASVEESRRLHARLREMGRDVTLLEVPGGPHAFNFKDEEKARTAWHVTVEFLETSLGCTGSLAVESRESRVERGR